MALLHHGRLIDGTRTPDERHQSEERIAVTSAEAQ